MLTQTPKPMAMRYSALALAAGLGLAAGSAHAQEDKGTVELAYVEWSSEVASTNVVRAVLEQQGYDVEINSLSASAMWQAIAHDDADAMVAAWLPTTHENYLEQTKDDVEDLGPNFEGTKLGLVVPADSDLESIEDINDHADELNGEIIGIDPGAGLMSQTETVLEEYDLDVDLRSGSGATMTSSLSTAIENDEPIVVTGWTPHWMFSRWELKYLDDPQNVYGDAERIHTVVRKGLKEDMPEAYAILDNFEWTPEQMGEVMLMNQEEDADPYENAKQWVENNQDVVEEWLAD
ncbi:glycine betaine ABC transporter substrate-binding protein [Aidingimonas lacisalsi]|uniref:glycine betaine ABC transporter substrate-binding protein n=1 Tax=Aidingimonas lacisalsi TaxID=2604086 RepID=UPI00191C64FC|nr:glycine betaine ABC transporter substrate-binding protein [Aidingimonas lacisalsi]